MKSCRNIARVVFKLINWRCYLNVKYIIKIMQFNKLSLNIEKSNFILFHSPQKKLQDSYFNLNLCNKQLKREYCIKYFGILIDCHLNWKKQVEFIGQKIRRRIGILCKLRHYVDLNI